MSLSAHITELKKKHENLSGKVEQAAKSPATDPLHVATLKKQKLRLKDQIERLALTEH